MEGAGKGYGKYVSIAGITGMYVRAATWQHSVRVRVTELGGQIKCIISFIVGRTDINTSIQQHLNHFTVSVGSSLVQRSSPGLVHGVNPRAALQLPAPGNNLERR